MSRPYIRVTHDALRISKPPLDPLPFDAAHAAGQNSVPGAVLHDWVNGPAWRFLLSISETAHRTGVDAIAPKRRFYVYSVIVHEEAKRQALHVYSVRHELGILLRRTPEDTVFAEAAKNRW